MSAEERLREGKLDEALAELQQQVRREPEKSSHRTFLFQLLTVLGQWDRAATQLNVTGELDPLALPMVQTYREALRCEALRRDIFAGRRSPLVFGDPQRWLALLIEALQLSANGEHGRAADVRTQAFDEAPATSGSLNGNRFEWIADADPRLGPVIEAVVNGGYYWVPFQRIRSIHFDPPVDLRDLVWTPAQFTWANGGEAVGLIPTRYPGSESAADPQLRLARKTEWYEPAAETYFGLGQRLFATDVGDFALMDARLLELDTAEAATAEPAGG